MDLQLVIAGGVFSLAGVLLGGLLTPLSQFFLERKRERRAADRAKILIAAEMLQAQLNLRTISKGDHWPPIEDVDAFLPTSAWREHRSSLAGTVREDLWNQIVIAYSVLEYDRSRIVAASKVPASVPLTPKIARTLKEDSNKLGDLRRELGGGGGWLDEIEDRLKMEPRM